MPAKHIKISQPNCLSCQKPGSELLPTIEKPKTSHKPTEGMGMVADDNNNDVQSRLTDANKGCQLSALKEKGNKKEAKKEAKSGQSCKRMTSCPFGITFTFHLLF